jgi:ribonuclease HII
MTRKIDPALIPEHPSLDFEIALWQAGCQYIGGVDEAGRGCLAGPVAAATVILPPEKKQLDFFRGVRDSKQLSREERDHFRSIIEEGSLAWGVGFATNEEIDRVGIVPATRLAVQRALDQLAIKPEHLLVDYLVLPDNPLPQTRLVKGDARSLSIAAASILAKTHRDALMLQAAGEFPAYGFDQNKGYGTSSHSQAILDHGPSPLHRLSFAPLKNL